MILFDYMIVLLLLNIPILHTNSLTLNILTIYISNCATLLDLIYKNVLINSSFVIGAKTCCMCGCGTQFFLADRPTDCLFNKSSDSPLVQGWAI